MFACSSDLDLPIGRAGNSGNKGSVSATVAGRPGKDFTSSLLNPVAGEDDCSISVSSVARTTTLSVRSSLATNVKSISMLPWLADKTTVPEDDRCAGLVARIR